MALAADAYDPEMAPSRVVRPKLDWPHALRALRRLLANKDDTTQVFEIMRALNGQATARGYHQLLGTVQGGRIAYEREEFAQRLMDDAWLDAFAEGTVGAAYREFVRSERLSAEGLAEVSREGLAAIEDPHPYAWFGRRTRDVHDIWHILSGYHRDALGEACLVAFSYAQTKGLGWLLIAVGAGFRSLTAPKQPYIRAIWQGYRRGKAARWLLGEDYHKLMAEPLASARRRLNITPATIYDNIPADQRDLVVTG
ncbi:Coq4 family protein [Phenylobacterium deserti]|uniref:Ubiquinone biosynthesis protein n=1 Tax=Phenylobacterium deserti TaxID=1914756 RepID=A0A328AEQ8_9CAUL|nr:Coq4 family protein [Phenylobacterium deserti]RAK51258.1 ubiquinone biosynthesis protein [Phenylobacterium deserti]